MGLFHFFSWVTSIIIFLTILLSRSLETGRNDILLTFIFLDVIFGIVNFIALVPKIERFFVNKYKFGIVFSVLVSLLLLALGFGSIYYALTNLPNNLNKISLPKISGNFLISPGLKTGSTGDAVKIVQAALSLDKGIYPSGIISGYYGDLTRSAVINFQTKHQLPQTGEVDEKTSDKFNTVYGGKNREYYLSLVPVPAEIIEIRTNLPIDDGTEWGKAKQISEHTWTMKVGFDEVMATPREIYEALNNYRILHGKNSLGWDDRLAEYALSRAKYFTQIGNLDEHAGFSEYLKNEDNFKTLGFWGLGENSSYGYRLSGTHLIEWVYAGDKPHNDNQLSSDWSHVGIGVDGNQTNLIFGGNKM